MQLSNNQQAFLALVRAGLWEKEVRLASFGQIDFNEVYRLAEEQSVVGLVAAGIEHVNDVKLPQEMALQFAGQTLQLEQRNQMMNDFVAELIERLRKEDIYCLLVKGQGIAQCYERPLWRPSGDVDLLISDKNYTSTKSFFDNLTGKPAITTIKNQERCHLEYYIDTWLVELHGTLHTNLSRKVDYVIDVVQDRVFSHGEVRVWRNGETDIFIPSPDNDVIFVFTHILQHLFRGGIGLRQLCDLSRLLWTFSGKIDIELLKKRLRDMGLLSEWKALGAVLVNTLGLPVSAMPLYDEKYVRKQIRLLSIIFQSGNFGHNKDYSYFTKYPSVIRKVITIARQTKESINLSLVFPLDSFKFLVRFTIDGIKYTFCN